MEHHAEYVHDHYALAVSSSSCFVSKICCDCISWLWATQRQLVNHNGKQDAKLVFGQTQQAPLADLGRCIHWQYHVHHPVNVHSLQGMNIYILPHTVHTYKVRAQSYPVFQWWRLGYKPGARSPTTNLCSIDCGRQVYRSEPLWGLYTHTMTSKLLLKCSGKVNSK